MLSTQGTSSTTTTSVTLSSIGYTTGGSTLLAVPLGNKSRPTSTASIVVI